MKVSIIQSVYLMVKGALNVNVNWKHSGQSERWR